MRTFLSLCILLTASANAQIYADFAVSRGGSSLGTFTVTLDHVKAPRTCANFIGLATGKRPWIDVTNGAVRTDLPFYDGLTFHRLIRNFVIQGGSRNGLGTDGPGYTILDEYEPTLRHSSKYVLSMAKGGFPNTGGSQFFITLAATPGLDNKHSVFGTVTSGTPIIDDFNDPMLYSSEANPTNGAIDKPVTDIVLDSVVVYGPDFETFDTDSPSLRLPQVGGTKMTVARDSAASTMTAIFSRQTKTAYFLLESSDLSTWSNPQHILSIDAATGQSHQSTGRTESTYFFNLATVSYAQVPNAPPSLLTQGNPVRIFFAGGSYLDFMFNGANGGTWYDSAQDRTGNLASTSWGDLAPNTGIIEGASPQAHNLPLGSLTTTLLDYPSLGQSIVLPTWLSFHTERTGWLEEIGTVGTNRFAFEIRSN